MFSLFDNGMGVLQYAHANGKNFCTVVKATPPDAALRSSFNFPLLSA